MSTLPSPLKSPVTAHLGWRSAGRLKDSKPKLGGPASVLDAVVHNSQTTANETMRSLEHNPEWKPNRMVSMEFRSKPEIKLERTHQYAYRSGRNLAFHKFCPQYHN